MCESCPIEAAHSDHVELDQVAFRLDDEAHEAFVALLDAPPPPTEELRKLVMTRPA